MSLRQRDGLTALALGVVAIILRLPYRSALPYHWDSAEFALAITNYNITHSEPHAPGYFLYVMLGRLVNTVVGNPHTSLVWVSMVAGSALVPVMYYLGLRLFDRRVGVIAGLLAMTSPQTWFHSEVALTYIVDALLVCLTVLICWRAIRRGGRWSDAVLIGVILAVVGGVRQQSVPALGPVILYTFWRFEKHRLAKLVLAGAVAFALGLAWFVPMVATTGGLSTYLEIVRRHAAFNAPATWAGGGLDALKWNIFFLSIFSANGLMLAVIPLLSALFYRKFVMGEPLQLLAAWVGGMILLGTMVGFVKQPGYVLNFLPGLLLLAAVALVQLRTQTMILATSIICGFNVVAFMGGPRACDRIFFGTARTAREIRERSEQLGKAVASIRSECRPDHSVICHVREYLYFGPKQFQLLLPEFDQDQLALDTAMLTPAGKPRMSLHRGQLQFVSGSDWTGKQRAILVIPPDLTLKIFDDYFDLRDAQPVAGASGLVYTVLVTAQKMK